MKKKTIVLVGGGTGGHAAPVLAVYENIIKKNSDLNIVVIGNGSPEERQFYNNLPNYRIIRSGKVHRYLTLKNVSEMINIFVGFFQSLFILIKLKPSVIFSKGGHVSFPLIQAAIVLKIPYLQHESDIEMGKVNRILARKAKKVFTTYPIEYFKYVDNDKLCFSGPVIRNGLKKSITGLEDYHVFEFEDKRPTLLITGGSQGSLNLSQSFLKIAKEILSSYNVIHQAGKHSIKEVLEFKKNLNDDEKKRYYVTDFLSIIDGEDMMSKAVNLSDLVITRAGSTIIELAIIGKPMIIVPWINSAQDHQNKNADYFEKNNAACIIREDNLSGDTLSKNIEELFSNNREKMKFYTKNAISLFPNNGAEKIADSILIEVKK